MKKFFGVTVTLIITLYLLIEFIGDRLIKNILQNNISSALNREVSIENLNIDYLSGEANAKGISLLNKNFEGFFVKIENVKVELDAFSIFSNDVIINNVLLENEKQKDNFKDFERECMQFGQHSKPYNLHNSCLIVIWDNKKQEWQLWFGT